jgi:hypothetical protein
MNKLLFSICLLVAAGGSLQAGTLALDVPAGTFSGSQAYFLQIMIGWSFDVSSPITVTDLGIWDDGSAPLVESHQVGLWANGGALLAQTTVTNANSTPVPSIDSAHGQWLFVPISSVVLDPGTYVLGEMASSRSGDAERQFYESVITAPQISYSQARIDYSGTFIRPDAHISSREDGIFGPNLQFTAEATVPEPATALPLLAAIAALWAARRRMRLSKALSNTACWLILPVMAAVQARADVVALPISNFVCDTSGTYSSDCTADSTVTPLSAGGDGIQGLKFFGPNGGGVYSIPQYFGGGTLNMTTEGPLDGRSGGVLPAGTLIPVHYSFNVNGAAGEEIQWWQLTFYIRQGGGPGTNESSAIFNSPSTGFTGLQTGSGTLQVVRDFSFGTDTTVGIQLFVFGNYDGTNIEISVPQNSFDFEAVPAASPVPEPTTAALGMIGLTLVVLWKCIRGENRRQA